MAIVKVRIQADSREEADQAIQFLTNATSGAVTMGKPREGTNPKYEGNQKWASYGELDLSVLQLRKRGGT